MKRIIFCIVYFVYSPLLAQQNLTNFEKEITRLQSLYKVENISLLVKKGTQIIYSKKAINDTLLFPIASLTKIFASVLVMQLIENQQLSLEDYVIKYLPNLSGYPSIKVKHLLSHTSQGVVGRVFYYSNTRYALLGKILKKISRKPFEALLQERILNPANMQHTFLLKDSLQIKNLGQKIAKGKYEYGFSASGGLVSCVEDLAKFDDFLNQNSNYKIRELMFMPFYSKSPYGLGVFTQKVAGKQVIWGYGQTSSFASLYIKIPEENLTFVLLANNHTINNYPKLIYGDLTTSLFALCFLENFAIPQTKLCVERTKAEVLKELYLENFHRADSILQTLSTKRVKNAISVLHAIFTFKMKTKNSRYDSQFLSLTQKLLKKEPQNPYLYFYLGNYYDMAGKPAKARLYFNKLINLPNFDKNWYTEETENYLKINE